MSFSGLADRFAGRGWDGEALREPSDSYYAGGALLREPSREPSAAGIGTHEAWLSVRHMRLSRYLATWSNAGRLHKPRSHRGVRDSSPLSSAESRR